MAEKPQNQFDIDDLKAPLLAAVGAADLFTVFAVLVGKADFSGVGDGAIFSLPEPFAFGAPTFQIAAILSMTLFRRTSDGWAVSTGETRASSRRARTASRSTP